MMTALSHILVCLCLRCVYSITIQTIKSSIQVYIANVLLLLNGHSDSAYFFSMINHLLLLLLLFAFLSDRKRGSNSLYSLSYYNSIPFVQSRTHSYHQNNNINKISHAHQILFIIIYCSRWSGHNFSINRQQRVRVRERKRKVKRKIYVFFSLHIYAGAVRACLYSVCVYMLQRCDEFPF